MEIKNETFIDENGHLMKKIPVFTMKGLEKEMKHQDELKKKNN